MFYKNMINANKKWEQIIDFTKFKKDGISAKELLNRLKKLNLYK